MATERDKIIEKAVLALKTIVKEEDAPPGLEQLLDLLGVVVTDVGRAADALERISDTLERDLGR